MNVIDIIHKSTTKKDDIFCALFENLFLKRFITYSDKKCVEIFHHLTIFLILRRFLTDKNGVEIAANRGGGMHIEVSSKIF